MSMGYKADVRSESTRGAPGSPIAKKRSFQSAPSVKRKPLSAKSAHSSIRAIESDKLMMPQEKKSSPAIIKTDSRDLEKDTALPQNIKIKNISLIDHKRREFLSFRKQLIQQQNIYIDLYAQLRDLEDRSGVPAGTTVGEVRLLSVTDWPVHDLLLLTENTPNQPQNEVKGILGPKILQQLSSQLTGIPGEVVAMGTELMSRRLDMLEFIRALQRKEKVLDDNNNEEWQTMNAEFEEDTEKLRRLVLATAKSFETKIIHSLDVAKIPWIDRDNMIKKIESLQKELTVNKKAKPDDAVPNDNAHEQQHKNILDELSKERSARLTLKEMLTCAEGKMATARARITELERQLNATRAELASAHRRLDNLKQLHHYRASNHDANSKKSEKVSKNGDVTIGILSRQRDALELRVRELQEQTTLLTRDSEVRESQLTSQIESLELKLDEQVQNRDSLEARVQELERSLNDVQEQYNVLKEHSRQLVALEHQKNLEYLPRKSQCSNQDIEIWNDLQATKGVLDRVKIELENSRADKDSLLTSLARIAHEGPENKMAEELLNREQKITKMRKIIDELLENKRTMEKNIACYENQLAALRFEVNVLRNFNSYTSQKELPHQDLETEVFNLCLQVETLKRERAALISEAASRALLLERHERSAELFAQVTRARRALAAQLEGNALPSMDTGDDHEVTASLTKAYLSSADTWSALRAERARVLQLEDTVRSQQLQLTRESLRRVQHEQRRSNLERELIRNWAGNLRQGHNGVQVASALYANTLRSDGARPRAAAGGHGAVAQQLQLTRESLMRRVLIRAWAGNLRQNHNGVQVASAKKNTKKTGKSTKMMKPTSKIMSQGPETGEDKSGTPNHVSSVRLPSPNARRRTLTAEKRSASLTRNPSKQMLQLYDDQLSISASMKSVAIVKEEHTTPLPRNVMIKNLRLMAKKRRDLTQMRKSLIQQQNTYLDLYAQLRDLEAKSGIDAGDSVGEVRVLAVTGWPAYDLLLLVRNDLHFIGHTDVNGVLGPSILKELNSQLSTIPEEVLSMGADLMARRLEVLEYLRSRCRSERNDWKSKNAEFDAVSENLHKLVVDTAKNLEAKVVHSQQIAKTAWIDRDILLKKIERLQKELTICQNKIETTLPASEEKHEPGDQNKNDHNATTDPSSNTTKLVEELNKERAARECLKQVVSSAEGMLRAARARIAALERQLRDARAELENTIKKHKEYEQLHRHRETSYDVRSKKLLQVSKTGEVTIEMLSRQRDALELRVKELLDQTKSVEQSYEAQQSEQKSRLESLQAKLVEQEKHRNIAEKRIQEQEERLKNMQEEYNQLRERSERLVQMDKERCLDILPRKENEPSEKETEIWKDLQASKMKLERVTEELRQSRADKESLLQSLSRIAQEGSENNMANELLIREQKIFKLQRDIEQQKQAIKSLQESTVQKDNQLSALKMEVGRLRSYDCYSNKENPKQDLTLEVLDLSTKVATLKRERESLVSEAASRALMLERHERCAELFAHVTRTRRELAAHLEGRSENQLAQDGFVKVTPSVRNSLSSACLKAAETWSELRSDRERVLRLQNIVMSQNLQLERESRIRTQLEHRRAILERIFFSHVNSSQHNSLDHQLPYSFENEES